SRVRAATVATVPTGAGPKPGIMRLAAQGLHREEQTSDFSGNDRKRTHPASTPEKRGGASAGSLSPSAIPEDACRIPIDHLHHAILRKAEAADLHLAKPLEPGDRLIDRREGIVRTKEHFRPYAIFANQHQA